MDYRYTPDEGECVVLFGDLIAEWGEQRNRGIGVHATPPPRSLWIQERERGMRKANFVELPSVNRIISVQEEDATFEDGGDILEWVAEIRCLVHAAQFVQVEATCHSGSKLSITYCGPFLVEWAPDSLDG